MRPGLKQARRFWSFLLAAFVAALPICGLGSAAAQDKVTIAIGTANPGASNAQIFAAKALGFFKEENLDVQFVNTNGALEAARAVAAGQVDFMSGALEPIPVLRAAGEPLQTIAQIAYGSQFSIAFPSSSKISSVKELPGKRIGIVSAGSAAGPVALVMLRLEGVDTSKITLVPIGGGQSALTAIESGAVDALSLFDSLYLSLEKAGIKYKGLPGPPFWMHEDFRTKYPGQGIVYSTDEEKRLKDIAPRLLRALFKSIVYCTANHVAAVDAMAKLEPLVLDDKKLSIAQWASKAPLYELPETAKGMYGHSTAEMWDVLLSSIENGGEIRKKVNFPELFTDKYLKAANDFDRQAIVNMAKSAK